MTTISQLGMTPYRITSNSGNGRKVSTPINNQNTQPSTKSRITKFAFGAAAIAAGIGLFIISRGKAIQQNKKLLKEIPEDLQTHFAKLKNLNGKEFIDKAYAEMVDYMKLNGIAPKSIGKLGADNPFSINGGYHTTNNTIEYTDGFFTKLSKPEQLNMLTHELKHCEQFTNILRTEGIGIEKYAEAITNATINSMKKDFTDIKFHMAWKRAKSTGTEKEFFEKIKEKGIKDISQTIEKNFSEVLKMPKIKANSQEGIKAIKDLDAERVYEGTGFLGIGGQEYKNNPLEIEAYAFGDKMQELFIKYEKATN